MVVLSTYGPPHGIWILQCTVGCASDSTVHCIYPFSRSYIITGDSSIESTRHEGLCSLVAANASRMICSCAPHCQIGATLAIMFADVDRFNKICSCTCRQRRSTHLAAMVKRERSPSPTISDPHRPGLVTEGAVRYAPIPEQCRKGYPGFHTSRRIWAEEAKKRLRGYNLEPTRVFIRSVVLDLAGTM